MSELSTISPTLINPITAVRAAIGRVTMYRLVLTSLGGLAVVALLCSLAGAISYPPIAVLATLCISLGVSYVSNRAIAALFKVVPHSESSLISGLLLFFIFAPTTNPVPLLGVGLAAALASCSKYVLAVRGRHIFNPAAAGAFLLTLTGLYYSAWWVGNPVLLPFSLIAAAVILSRVRKFEMALVFLAVSAAIMVLRSLWAGLDPITAIEWPVTSSPIIFFAAFMLTEPLTRPPLRWQQLAFAAVIGFLFSTPMHLGTIYIAPESALLVGNALAFLVGQRKGIELVLQGTSQVTPTTVEFSFRPQRRLRFAPGQYLELTLPHKHADNRGLRRVFSIASAPNRPDLIKIGTRVPAEASSFKRALEELTEGAVVTATTISGDFVLPHDRTAPLLLIAGGIGITPFVSQLQNLDAGHGRDIIVLYSVSDPSEIAYRDVLEASGARVFVISALPVADLAPNWQSIRARRIDRAVLERSVPDISRRHVLISGPPQMVDGIGQLAKSLKAHSVRTDYFSGY